MTLVALLIGIGAALAAFGAAAVAIEDRSAGAVVIAVLAVAVAVACFLYAAPRTGNAEEGDRRRWADECIAGGGIPVNIGARTFERYCAPRSPR